MTPNQILTHFFKINISLTKSEILRLRTELQWTQRQSAIELERYRQALVAALLHMQNLFVYL